MVQRQYYKKMYHLVYLDDSNLNDMLLDHQHHFYLVIIKWYSNC
eukprot:UN05582